MPAPVASAYLDVKHILEQIDLELAVPTASLSPTRRRLAQVRRLLEKACLAPPSGRLASLKRLLFRLHRADLGRQYDVNDALLKLVEDLYDEMDRVKAALAEAGHEVWAGQLLDGQDTDEGDGPAVAGLAALHAAPTEMMMAERLLLYSLALGLKPNLCVEIGTFRGGSATILCAAMDDNGHGRLVCVDPEPRISDSTWRMISHRANLYQADSPGVLSTIPELTHGGVDFVLIDGDHSREAVLADVRGVLPFLADQAHLLFHDCHYREVRQAIEDLLAEYPGLFVDCGVLSVHETFDKEHLHQDPLSPVWAGLRLLRYQRGRE